jgi:hypothetical protein
MIKIWTCGASKRADLSEEASVFLNESGRRNSVVGAEDMRYTTVPTSLRLPTDYTRHTKAMSDKSARLEA